MTAYILATNWTSDICYGFSYIFSRAQSIRKFCLSACQITILWENFLGQCFCLLIILIFLVHAIECVYLVGEVPWANLWYKYHYYSMIRIIQDKLCTSNEIFPFFVDEWNIFMSSNIYIMKHVYKYYFEWISDVDKNYNYIIDCYGILYRMLKEQHRYHASLISILWKYVL